MRMALIRGGKIVKEYTAGVGSVLWADGAVSMPVPSEVLVRGDQRLVPIVNEVVDNSTGPHKFSTVETLIGENRVLRTTTLTDAPAPDVTEIHKAWLKAYLAEAGWLDELEAIIAAGPPVAQILWADGSDFAVTDGLVQDLWANHSQAANMTVQDVFNAAAELRETVRGY